MEFDSRSFRIEREDGQLLLVKMNRVVWTEPVSGYLSRFHGTFPAVHGREYDGADGRLQDQDDAAERQQPSPTERFPPGQTDHQEGSKNQHAGRRKKKGRVERDLRYKAGDCSSES